MTHKKRGPGEGKPRGRPVKNLSKKIKDNEMSKSDLNSTKGDGFNVRMQNPDNYVVDNRGSNDIKLLKFFADPETKKIYYSVF